jgi:hypothetical protein
MHCFAVADQEQLRRLVFGVQVCCNCIADCPVIEQIKQKGSDVFRQIPSLLRELQGHAADAAPGAVFENDNWSDMRCFQGGVPIFQ